MKSTPKDIFINNGKYMTEKQALSILKELSDSQLIELYKLFKSKYYEGNPIISDALFDDIENYIKLDRGLDISDIVGHTVSELSDKIELPTPMLSLNKIQAGVDGSLPLSDISKWFSSFDYLSSDIKYEATPKFDGNAVKLIYDNGIFISAITRGDGKIGHNVTEKLKLIVPNTIPETSFVEINGEVIIKKGIFESKYLNKGYNLSRSYAAGVLGRKNEDFAGENSKYDIQSIKELDFIAFSYNSKTIKSNLDFTILPTLEKWGFKSVKSIQFKPNNFSKVYNEMFKYRNTQSEYELDGFVIKIAEPYRAKIGQSSHHPKWAVAIKFPPTVASTEIIDVEWNIGKTGEYTPVAILYPVNIDGSNVGRVTLHNLGYVKSNKTYDGAYINLYKSGDIIPKINSVLKEPDGRLEYPTSCKHCNAQLVVNDIHLLCPNTNCSGVQLQRLDGINVFDVKSFGSSTLEKLYKSGIVKIEDFFDKSKFNKSTLVSCGYFKDGKSLDNILSEIYKIKKVELSDVIRSLAIPGAGRSISREIAKMYQGLPYSFEGLDSKIVSSFEHNKPNHKRVLNFITGLTEFGIEIVKPKSHSTSSIPVILTGSPKIIGYKDKKAFLSDIDKYGFYEDNKKPKILITDSYTSSSSKMAKAKKNNWAIFTYEDFQNKYMK